MYSVCRSRLRSTVSHGPTGTPVCIGRGHVAAAIGVDIGEDVGLGNCLFARSTTLLISRQRVKSGWIPRRLTCWTIRTVTPEHEVGGREVNELRTLLV